MAYYLLTRNNSYVIQVVLQSTLEVPNILFMLGCNKKYRIINVDIFKWTEHMQNISRKFLLHCIVKSKNNF